MYVVIKPRYACGDISDLCEFIGNDIIAVFRNDWKTVLFLRQYFNKDDIKVSDLPEEGRCKDFFVDLRVCNVFSDL